MLIKTGENFKNPFSFLFYRSPAKQTDLEAKELSRFKGQFSFSEVLKNSQEAIHLLRSAQSSMTDSRSSTIDVEPDHDIGGESNVFKPDYAEIIVICHGETIWNAEGRLQGHLDVDLNKVGRQQANAVAVQLSTGPKISAVYSSDLKRAYETAELIAINCGELEVRREWQGPQGHN
ncbi:unnamed protein product [Ilex paraguariensis]|uniref:Phosphoglycerate mutase n=1 Tax=Ilex paraguariensis TaxID=185542 RepID=A0ABC8TGQ3_9AQUA